MARKPRVHFPGALYHRSPMRISQAIIEFEEELRKDKCLRKMIEKLKEDLTKRGKKKYFITIA